MFEQIPMVANDGDGHYFKKWLDRINKGVSSDCNKKFIAECAQLEQLEESIRSSVKHINGKFVFIGHLLQRIEEERLFRNTYSGVADKYCADVYRYAFVRFGLKKTTTFNLIAVAKEFASFGELNKKWKEFSFSQLVELLPMSETDRAKVKPEMTIKQIRELKNTLALSSDVLPGQLEIPTSEFAETDCNYTVTDVKTQKIEKLAALLEEGDNYHLWENGSKDFNRLAEWLISQGVKI